MFIFLIIVFLFIIQKNFANNFKLLIPQKIKIVLKDNIPYYLNKKISNLLNENSKLTYREKVFKYDLNYLNFEKVSDIKYKNNKKNFFNLYKWDLPFPNITDIKPVAYIDKYNDKIIIVSGSGKILQTKIEENDLSLNNNLETKIIKNNLEEIINNDLFFNRGKVGIRDIKIIKNDIFLSYTKTNYENCYNTSILKGNFNTKFITFKVFYTYDECAGEDKERNLYSTGGRIDYYKDNKILFTIGEYLLSSKAQNPDSLMGKIISIDLDTSKHKVYSIGHRNPQGLLYLPKKNIILSTEHGPWGGDEINKIIKNENYGWPIVSYGEHYCKMKNSSSVKCKNLYKKYPLKKSHKEFQFIEPIKYFTPSIGISEIIEVPAKFNNFNEANYFIASLSGDMNLENTLKGQKLFNITFEDNYESVLMIDELLINDRIRDLIYLSDLNSILMILEKTPSLAILKIADKK